MPVDVRKLIFSKQELRLALQKFAKEQNLNVPESHVEDIQIVDNGQSRVVSDNAPEGLKVILHYTSSDPQNPIRVHLNENQILEALVNMCRGLKIPLPRRGQKFLAKHKDALALTIGMNEQDIRSSTQVG
ncbi:MAG: hypothetical protein JKY27_05205 [Magnetovibrio sp.]|nr:hypothetical protein [Magnetovibrio sp.]